MSQILLRTDYENGTAYGDRTDQFYGTTYDTYNWIFDTDSQAVTKEFAGQYDDFQDVNDPEAYDFQGEFYAYCAGTTRRGFVHDGAGGFTVEEEADSLSCGYQPPQPLTCELGAASVSQVATPGGATLTAAVTGTVHGRLQYQLDAGVEQASPVFYNVLPGVHALSLRDDGLSGCTRTVSVTVAAPPPPAAPSAAPVGVDLVGQPLWYATAPAPANADVALELWAESRHGAADFALVLTLRKRADTLGRVFFRLDTLLWPLLSAFVPAPASRAPRRSTTNLVNYFVRTSVLAPGRPPAYATGPLRTALRGSLPAEWRGTDYGTFRAGFSDLPCFLSWQPLGPGTYAGGQAKPVTYAQPEWLFWLCPVDAPTLRIRRAYDMGPGTSPVLDDETVGPMPAQGWLHALLAIPLAPARAGFARVSVQVITPAGEPLSPPAWYRFVEASERTRYLLFTNSLGGVDTLRCEGRLEGTLDATAQAVERPARYGDGAATAEQQLSDLSASRKLKLATGWLSPAELAWAQELVLTREAWLQVGAQLRGLTLAKRSLAPYADEPGLRGLLLEVDYAYAPSAYAPGTY